MLPLRRRAGAVGDALDYDEDNVPLNSNGGSNDPNAPGWVRGVTAVMGNSEVRGQEAPLNTSTDTLVQFALGVCLGLGTIAFACWMFSVGPFAVVHKNRFRTDQFIDPSKPDPNNPWDRRNLDPPNPNLRVNIVSPEWSNDNARRTEYEVNPEKPEWDALGEQMKEICESQWSPGDPYVEGVHGFSRAGVDRWVADVYFGGKKPDYGKFYVEVGLTGPDYGISRSHSFWLEKCHSWLGWKVSADRPAVLEAETVTAHPVLWLWLTDRSDRCILTPAPSSPLVDKVNPPNVLYKHQPGFAGVPSDRSTNDPAWTDALLSRTGSEMHCVTLGEAMRGMNRRTVSYLVIHDPAAVANVLAGINWKYHIQLIAFPKNVVLSQEQLDTFAEHEMTFLANVEDYSFYHNPHTSPYIHGEYNPPMIG